MFHVLSSLYVVVYDNEEMSFEKRQDKRLLKKNKTGEMEVPHQMGDDWLLRFSLTNQWSAVLTPFSIGSAHLEPQEG